MGSWRLERGTGRAEARELLEQCRPFLDLWRGNEPGAEVIQEGARTLLRVPEAGVLKVMAPKNARRAIGWLLVSSRFAAEFDNARTAALSGLPVPRPLFAAQRRVWGLPREAALLAEAIPGTVTLHEFIRGALPMPGRLRRRESGLTEALRALGALVARLHAAGGVHGDLHPHNVLVATAPPHRLWLVDWLNGFFLGGEHGRWPLGRYLTLRRAARHYKMAEADLREAVAAWRRGDGCDPAFRAVQHKELVKLADGLVRSGTPVRGLLECARAYLAHVGASASERRAAVRAVAAACLDRLAKRIGYNHNMADTGTRTVSVHREGAGRWCVARGHRLDEVRAAAPADAAATGRFEVLRGLPDTRAAWRLACGLAYAGLPARTFAACYLADHREDRPGDQSGRDVLVAERPEAPLEDAARCREGDEGRLAAFVRLFHAFGFRFRRCDGDTLRRQLPEAGGGDFRQGSGYLLHDVTAVEFAPGTPTDASVEVVAAWVGEAWGAAQADAVRRGASRKLLFSL